MSVSGQTVTLNTGKGKLSVYHGHAEAEKDGTMVFVKDAEFHMKEDGMEADSLGERTCLCAYEKEDYSGNEYRFRDDPVEENYDCTGLAVTDLISRRVSSMEEYMKTALAGSVVGALTGAAELVPVGGLVRVGVDFLAGASGSAAGQLITEGEVDAERMFQEGVLAAVMAAGARRLSNTLKKVNFESDLSFKFSEMTESEIAEVVEKYRKRAPVEIPDTATYKAKSMADGYEQISFKWNDGTYKYEVRWRTRTSGAPIDQGNTWVIQRTIPGSGGKRPSTQFLVGGNE